MNSNKEENYELQKNRNFIQLLEEKVCFLQKELNQNYTNNANKNEYMDNISLLYDARS